MFVNDLDSREEDAAHRVQHLQNFVLFTRVQPVDDDRHARLVLSEAVDGFGHFGHHLHFVLQDLARNTRKTNSEQFSSSSGLLTGEIFKV